jgi:predicted DNA-binding transcriptional regulator AlpA
MNIAPTLIDEKKAALMLSLSTRTLQMWRFQGVGPRFVRISRNCVRYDHADLVAWIEDNKTQGGKVDAANS